MRKILVAISLSVLAAGSAGAGEAPVSEETEACLECHASIHPGIVAEWQISQPFKAWRIEDVPSLVRDTALKAANAIGSGFYGVDIKQRGDSVYVIEVNDNPNVDAGVEDSILGDALYQMIIEELVRRVELPMGV